MTAQDSTSVTVSQLDANAGVTTVNGNDGFRLDQPTQTDQPVGPEPANGPLSPEVDGQ